MGDPGLSVCVAGIDGCRKGWVAVVLRDGRFDAVVDAPSIEALRSRLDVDAWGIDMPIGMLPDRFRTTDGLAKKMLGRRHSTIFPVPPRPVVECADKAQARQLCVSLTGKSFSEQAWNIFGPILEVDRAVADGWTPYEIAPELAFAAMAGEVVNEPKRTAAGRQRRIELLQAEGIELADEATEDSIDASAVAWSTARVVAGEATQIPDPPEAGFISIWY